MAKKKIREYDAKQLIYSEDSLKKICSPYQGVLITPETDLDQTLKENPWLGSMKLVAKPDQLFGKRKKHGLVLINASWGEVSTFLKQHQGKEVTIGKATDNLTHFLIEPFTPHEEEYFIAITAKRDADVIHFSETGGIDIEENWDNVKTIEILPLNDITNEDLANLTQNTLIREFIKSLFTLYKRYDFTYLEINPFTIKEERIFLLDTVAHIDSCAKFKQQSRWQNLEFPDEFGKKITPEERTLQEMDENSGASLKMTVLNPNGRIWTILAGGGASIIYLDMITNLGKGEEIANYGDLAGGPTTHESYIYAKTVLDLMTREKDPRGKILFILGCIANFTDVRKTFKGFIQALEEFQEKIHENNITIFVRRGGPNHEQGLAEIKEIGDKLKIPMYVHGPETSMEKIIEIAGEQL